MQAFGQHNSWSVLGPVAHSSGALGSIFGANHLRTFNDYSNPLNLVRKGRVIKWNLFMVGVGVSVGVGIEC